MERSQSLTHLGTMRGTSLESSAPRVPACRPLYLSRVGRTPATPAHGRTDMSHDARKCHNPTNLQVQLHPPRPAFRPRPGRRSMTSTTAVRTSSSTSTRQPRPTTNQRRLHASTRTPRQSLTV